MVSHEKFCIRWNDFENNVSGAFRELREEEDLFDVTLACEDDQIQAHKVLLSACSPFFRNVLCRNHHQHPLLYLKGVEFSELASILNFMYMGEVAIAQEDLDSFLVVADELQIKGLSQKNFKASKFEEPMHSSLKFKSCNLRQENAEAEPIDSATLREEDIPDAVPIKSESNLWIQKVVLNKQKVENLTQEINEKRSIDVGDTDEGHELEKKLDGYKNETDVQGSNLSITSDRSNGLAEIFQQLDEIIDTKCRKEGGNNMCNQCDYTTKILTNMKNHVETKHMSDYSIEIPCRYCSAVFSTRGAMRIHLKRKHTDNKM